MSGAGNRSHIRRLVADPMFLDPAGIAPIAVMIASGVIPLGKSFSLTLNKISYAS